MGGLQRFCVHAYDGFSTFLASARQKGYNTPACLRGNGQLVFGMPANQDSDTLEKLFGSPARLKLLRFFILNPETGFERGEIMSRTRVRTRTLTKELNLFLKIKFLKKRFERRQVSSTRKKRKTVRVTCYLLNEQFTYLAPLREFLTATSPVSEEELLKRIRTAGKIKLVILSGLFMQEPERRLDLLIVGENIRGSYLSSAVKQIEYDIGREVRFATLTEADFRFRLSIQDRLVRDVFDYQYRVLLDRIAFQ